MRRENDCYDMRAEMRDNYIFLFGLISTGADPGILDRGVYGTAHANTVA